MGTPLKTGKKAEVAPSTTRYKTVRYIACNEIAERRSKTKSRKFGQ